jgi:hypothetical protein
MSLCFHGRHFNWTFLLANVQLPMLGADFFRHFRLVVDLAASQMLDTIFTTTIQNVYLHVSGFSYNMVVIK